MSHNCGACKFFIKLKNDRFGGGLCSFKDARTKTDAGHWCSSFKRVKFYKPLIEDSPNASE